MSVVIKCFSVVTAAPHTPKLPGAYTRAPDDNTCSTGLPFRIVYSLKVTSHVDLISCLGVHAGLTGCAMRGWTPPDRTRPGAHERQGKHAF